jgi:predicted nucleotidyltransferase
MDQAAVIAAIRRFRRALEANHITVERMVLFGSHAEGAAREQSDIDVAVISGDFSAQGFWERIRLLSDAIYEVGLPIEAVALSPEEWERADRPIVVFARKGMEIN